MSNLTLALSGICHNLITIIIILTKGTHNFHNFQVKMFHNFIIVHLIMIAHFEGGSHEYG